MAKFDSLQLVCRHWLDESNYPDAHAEPEHLAWEFLRRNQNYQEDYFVAKDCDEQRRKVGNWRETAAHKRYRFLCWRYRINEICDPEENYSSALGARLGLVTSASGDRFRQSECSTLDADIRTVPELPGQIVIKFDIAFSIEAQIERARKRLDEELAYYQRIEDAAAASHVEYERRWAPLKKQLRPEQLPTYLRVLDGIASSASLQDLADELFKDHADPTRAANRAKKTALSLRDTDYIYIPLLRN